MALSAKQKAYIAAHVECYGVKRRAAMKAKIAQGSVYNWLNKSEEFREALKEAEQQWFDELRARAVERALEKSDTLMIFLLKSFDPEAFDDNIRKIRYLADNNLEDPNISLNFSYIPFDDDDEEEDEEESQVTH